tara:strand:+ start:268 stop:822 length:555 start_codon:yes stop_codon:yes gene_type:complete
MALTKLNFTGQPTLPSANMPTGSVIQTVQTYDNTNEQTYNATAFTNISHLNTTITPKLSNSKFLIQCTISGAHNDDAYVGFKLYKGNTEITGATHTAGSPGTGCMFGFTVDRGAGGNVGHHLQTVSAKFLHTHGGDTSTAQTYKIYVSPMRTITRYFYYNRVGIYGDANQLSGVSSMTIQEIAG